MVVTGVGKFYGAHYAYYEPFDRTDAAEQGIQPWQPPGYSVFDMHASYALGDLIPVAGGGDVRLFVNVHNVFDQVFVQDAVDNSAFNSFDGDHDADNAEIFLGYPRNINLGFQITF